MLYSMTGFGRSEKNTESQQIVVEIKSVNSKSFDMRSRISSQFHNKEIEFRKLLKNSLLRGKIDLTVTVENTQDNENTINAKVFNNYFNSLTALAKENNFEPADMLSTIVRLPGVVSQNNDTIIPEQWEAVLEATKEALEALIGFRSEEGAATSKDIEEHIANIEKLLFAVDPEEQGRIDKIKSRLLSSLEQLKMKGKVDENCLEQEMVYYLDKFDLNEEKVRLKQHCLYFIEELGKDVKAKGKKLNFILQEMGREINTMGSKANSADIQKIVIQMKNEADKIKEQLANVL